MKLYRNTIDKFLESLSRRGLSPKTSERHAQNLKYFRAYLRSKHINRENLENFVTYYQKNHKPNTVNSAICTLKLLLRFLYETGKIKYELYYFLRSVKGEPFNPFIPTTEQVQSVINCPETTSKYHSWIDRRKYDLFFKLLAWLALRRFEALNLKIKDIDFTNDEIRIIGKGSYVRTLPLPKLLRGDLHGWFEEREAKPNDWVFQSRTGTICGAAVFTDELKKRLEALNIKGVFTSHTFRRYWITEAVRAGMNTTMIMKYAGHTNFATHLKYVKLVAGDLRPLADEHPINKSPIPERPRDIPVVPIFLTLDNKHPES
ncbi:MAG: site-specific integrase [Candidatus Curtissbacteria bacterium]|nr:site-specific integrase [Candidatus Curtissbacteria bacterium]